MRRHWPLLASARAASYIDTSAADSSHINTHTQNTHTHIQNPIHSSLCSRSLIGGRWGWRRVSARAGEENVLRGLRTQKQAEGQMSRADSPRYPFSRCFFVPLTRRGHSTSISEVSANADGDEGLTEMASAMQSSASRLMTRCEMSPPLARPGMGLSARPLRCCLFIESPTLPFLLLSSYSRHGISCWRTRNTESTENTLW